MERKYAIGDRVYTASAPAEARDTFRGELFTWITVDDEKRGVEILESGPHHLDLVIDGERRLLYFAAGDSEREVWLSAGGRARRLKLSRRDGGSRRGAGSGDRQRKKVTPSFPATVVKVMVSVGEVVERGQPLVVVSAMKMEMTLTAPHSGVVGSINTAQGAAVSPGDELVVVEAVEEREGAGETANE